VAPCRPRDLFFVPSQPCAQSQFAVATVRATQGAVCMAPRVERPDVDVVPIVDVIIILFPDAAI
jgi:hypothetical protein